jgi:hypothetical protein
VFHAELDKLMSHTPEKELIILGAPFARFMVNTNWAAGELFQVDFSGARVHGTALGPLCPSAVFSTGNTGTRMPMAWTGIVVGKDLHGNFHVQALIPDKSVKSYEQALLELHRQAVDAKFSDE